MIEAAVTHDIFRAPLNGIFKVCDLIDCHEHIVEYYSNRKDNINDRFSRLILTDDDCDIFGQDFGEEIYANNITFPFIHKSSQLISLYSILEVTVKNLSCLIDENIKSEIKLDRKSRKNELLKCREFLRKSCAIKFPDRTNDFIAEFIQLRNALVHSNGVIRKISCVRTKYVSIDNGTITDIDNTYIINSCNEIIDIFRSLGKQVCEITGIPSNSFFSYY